MKARLLSAAVCILILPIFLSPSAGDQPRNPSPFATIAMAGHVMPNGAYCECGSSSECICGPGEQRTQAASNQTATDANTATLDKQNVNGNPGAAVMLFTLVLLLGLRLRF